MKHLVEFPIDDTNILEDAVIERLEDFFDGIYVADRQGAETSAYLCVRGDCITRVAWRFYDNYIRFNVVAREDDNWDLGGDVINDIEQNFMELESYNEGLKLEVFKKSEYQELTIKFWGETEDED